MYLLSSIIGPVFGVAFLCLSAILPAHAQIAAVKWESSRSENGTRYLTYSATATIMGMATPISVRFFCDPAPSKNDVHGTVGFDFYLSGVARLKPFNFSDFEGPDARTGKLMLVTVNRKGKPPLTYSLAPSGGTPHESNFVFGIADESRVVKSDAKSILKALSDDGESMEITITDSRNRKLKIELTVPVADKQAEFKALLAGLK